MDNEIWKVLIDNQVYEIDIEGLKIWIKESRVLPDDKVQQGNLPWIEAKNVPLLKNIFDQLIPNVEQVAQSPANQAVQNYQNQPQNFSPNYKLPPNQSFIQIPGFEGRRIIFQKAGLFSSPKLFIDGKEAQRAEKKGQYLLCYNNGSTVKAYFRSMFLDPIPKLVVGEQTILIAEPFKPYEWFIVGLPFVLVLFGGAIGGMLGGIAAATNGYIFRSKLDTAIKYLACMGTLVFSGVSYLVLAVIITLVFDPTARGSLKKAININKKEVVKKSGKFGKYKNFDKSVPYIKPNWRDFSSTKGEFKVSMPGEPTEDIEEINSSVGVVTRHRFVAKSRYYSTYRVSYMQLPIDADISDPQKILNDSCQNSLKNVRGTVTFTSDVGPTKDNRGVSLTRFSMRYIAKGEIAIAAASAEIIPIEIFGKAFLVNNRIYLVEAFDFDGSPVESEAEKFFSTFSFQ